MVVWRMANKDVLKFDAIFAMKAVEFLNYALLIHDILEAERMEAERFTTSWKPNGWKRSGCGGGRTLCWAGYIYHHGV